MRPNPATNSPLSDQSPDEVIGGTLSLNGLYEKTQNLPPLGLATAIAKAPALTSTEASHRRP